MYRIKKTLSILLLISLAMSVLVSCGGEDNAETQSNETAASDSEAAVTTAETMLESNVPKGTVFDGREFTMASSDYNEYYHSFVEEMNGEVLNDAIYNMMLLTESTLDVKLTEVSNSVFQLHDKVAQLAAAGDSTYDAVTHLDRFAVNMMLDGSLIPLESSEYIDLSAPYWNPAMAGKLSLGGNTYYAVSSYNLLTLVNTSCYYFNSRMMNDFSIKPDEVYSNVDNGSWTYDKFSEYLKIATADINGDGIMDGEDRWGVTSSDWNIFGTTTLASCEEYTALKDKEDIPYMAWDNPKFAEVAELIFNIMNGGKAWTKSERYTADSFVSGKSLFLVGDFYTISKLSDMEDDYGIIPPPKYNEAQKNYYCECYDAMYTTIPISAADPKFSGAVLETLSFIGADTIIDPYIDVTLKYKKSRDERTIDMIQQCMDSRVIDIGVIYCYDYAGYDALHAKVFNTDSFNISSFIAKNNDLAVKRLESIVETTRKVQ